MAASLAPGKARGGCRVSSTGLLYRTQADVRAIPNAQWERWHLEGTNPLSRFSADARTQLCLRHTLKAHARRIGAR